MQVGTDWAGDYSRFSFDEADQYMMVLKEQGKPVLDDEMNLMGEIPITLLRRLIMDAFGDSFPGDAFKIVGTGASNDFAITGGNGTLAGAARGYIDGWMIILQAATTYGGQPETQAALTTPGGARTDEVYLDIWLDEIAPADDADIVDPVLNVETSRRLGLKWAVKVAEGSTTPADYNDGDNHPHWTCHIATINRTATATISAEMVVDERNSMNEASTPSAPAVATWVRSNIADGDDIVVKKGSTTWTKDASSAWAAGNAGLLQDALAPNTTYAIYEIENDTTGARDYLASTGLTTPTGTPSGWSVVERISVFLTDGSSNVRPFQQGGNYIKYLQPPLVVSNTSMTPGTAYTATVPGCLPDRIVRLASRLYGASASTDEHYQRIRSAELTTISGQPIQSGLNVYSATIDSLDGLIEAAVNSSRQVKYAASGADSGTQKMDIYLEGCFV